MGLELVLSLNIIESLIILACVIISGIFLIKKIFEWDVEDDYFEYRDFLIDELDEDNNIDQTLNEETKKDKRDIIALMLKNNDEVNEYFKISKRHAKSSYRFSIISCIFGLIILGISIYFMIVVKEMKYAIIGMVSGAITEVISGTVLWIHNKSALQLNHYYDALHENEKFLSAINMADKLSDEKREQVYIEIIRKQIN